MTKLGNVMAIVRSLGERTTEACQILLGQVFPEDNVCVVQQNHPLENALKAFELAIEGDQEWSLMVDANILLDPSALHAFIEDISKVHEQVYCVKANVVDKLAPFNMGLGVQAYRTSFLKEHIREIESSIKEGREGSFHQEMGKNGYKILQSSCPPIGVHDEEQFYKDIYRRAYIYALHFPDWASNVIPLWRGRGQQDPDFRVALKGYGDGIAALANIGRELEGLQKDGSEKVQELGLQEKGTFSVVNSEFVYEKLRVVPSSNQMHVYYDAKFVEVVAREPQR